MNLLAVDVIILTTLVAPPLGTSFCRSSHQNESGQRETVQSVCSLFVEGKVYGTPPPIPREPISASLKVRSHSEELRRRGKSLARFEPRAALRLPALLWLAGVRHGGYTQWGLDCQCVIAEEAPCSNLSCVQLPGQR